MKRMWAVVALVGWGLAGAAMAQTIPLSSKAPAPALVTPSGDSYQFLSELYHEGADRRQDRRSVVALCFIEQDSAACAEVLPQFMAVAVKMQSHEVLRGKARFYLVDADPRGRADRLPDFLARNRVGPPVLAFLDPYRKVCREFGVDQLPRTFVISRRGILVADLEGAGADYAKALAAGVVKAVKDAGSEQKPARVAAVLLPSVRGDAAEESDPDQPMRW